MVATSPPVMDSDVNAAWVATEFVIAHRRDSNANLRKHLLRIIKRAGLTSWPKLFQNLRATRETELAETYPLHVVTAWLGNSQLVAAKHYLQVTDQHFAKATQIPTQQAAEISDGAGESGNYSKRLLRENEKAPEFPGLSAAGSSFRNLHNRTVPRRGLEPPRP